MITWKQYETMKKIAKAQFRSSDQVSFIFAMYRLRRSLGPMKASPLGTLPRERECSLSLHIFVPYISLQLLVELPGSSGLRAHQDSEKVRKHQVILLVGEGTLRVPQDVRRGRKPSKTGNLQLAFCTLCIVQKD